MINNHDLFKIFFSFGTILSLNYGFIEFKNEESAQRALYNMKNRVYYNKTLYISRANNKLSLSRNCDVDTYKESTNKTITAIM